jgi:hypothetical protein
MTWLIWRQHRSQLATAIALVAALAVPVAITGRHLTDAITACQSGGSCGNLFQDYNWINTIVDITVIVPLLIGVFWGATIAGREFETGTASLVWTQSVTRRRWIGSKLVTLFGFTAACSGAVSGLVTWWSKAHNAVVESRFAGLQFDIQGVAPIGYALFASALGLAAGVLWRRALPAMATTVGGFVAVRLGIELFARRHYMSPVVRFSGLSGVRDPAPNGSLMQTTDLVHNGRVVSGPVKVPQGCSEGTRQASDACMSAHGYGLRSVYQPANRYWTFQWIEFGIFVGMGALLVAVAVLLLRRRDA